MNYSYLIVEGPHDAAFVAKILRRAGLNQIRFDTEVDPFLEPLIPRKYPNKGDLLKRVPVPSFHQNADHSIAIHVADGHTNIVKAVEESFVQIDKSRLSAFGVIIDADAGDPQSRFDSLVSGLTQHIPTWPATPGTVHAGPPRTGIFVLPDNQSRGTLEDILLESAAAVWPPTLELAKGYVNAAAQTISATELDKPAGINKATVACISNLLRPGKAVQVSIHDNDWLTAEPLNSRFRAFLHQLLLLPG